MTPQETIRAFLAGEREAQDKQPRVAIVGRPNVGKSTLVNALVGEERVIAFGEPGTTRDAIEVPFERSGRKYTLIDTAGLRKRGKSHGAEVESVSYETDRARFLGRGNSVAAPQALRDPAASAPPLGASPEGLVRDALRLGARVMVSTYNEPLITVEWAVAIFREARAQGLATAFVSNGNGTPRVLEYLRPHIDAYKVDLKSFDDRHYRELGGRLQPILDTINWLHGAGVWLEIVTLLVPGFNDSEAELTGLTEFVASVSPDIPWHVTAFHQDYRMTDPANTTPAMPHIAQF